MCCEEWILTIPSVGACSAAFVLILNVFFPGVGTLLLACLGPSISCGSQTCVGMLQIILSPFLIGWIWAVYWSFLVCAKVGKPNHPQIVVIHQQQPEIIVIHTTDNRNIGYNDVHGNYKNY